jgi:hypothetical protein
MNGIKSIKNREALYAKFKSTAIPTQKDFEDLINSVLVKRDDQFFGKWQPGIGYQAGDVVIYNKTLYVFLSIEEVESDTEHKAKYKDCNSDDDCCDGKTPDKCCRWKQIHVDCDDGDWRILKDKNDMAIGMYALAYGKIGIGDSDPQGFLHLNDKAHNSQFVFNPSNDAVTPTFKMIKGLGTTADKKDDSVEDNYPYVSLNLEQHNGEGVNYHATHVTNTLGFLFRRLPLPQPVDIEQARSLGEEEEPKEMISDMTLVFITSDESLRPRVGIGTDAPTAMLDAHDPDKGQVLIHPNKRTDPEILLVDLRVNTGGYTNYLASKVSGKSATFATDAPGGFEFIKGADYAKYIKNEGDEENETLVVFNGNGNVGIGVADPETKLEVTDNRQSGSFQFSLDPTQNPSFNIINLKPNIRAKTGSPQFPNYLAFGTDDYKSVISTDSKEGLTFRKGRDLNKQTEGINISRGDDILALRTDDDDEPSVFSALLKGYLRSKGAFIEPIPQTVDNDKEIKDALKLLNALKPRTYKNEDEKERFGLFVDNVRQTLPDSCKTFPDGDEAIGYHDLVVLLIKAVQELSDEVAKLKKQL